MKLKVSELQPGMTIEYQTADEDRTYIGHTRTDSNGRLYLDSDGLAYYPCNTDILLLK